MESVYRWIAPDTLDLKTTVRPNVEMPDFELFLSSYFSKGFLASVYLRDGGRGQPGFVAVDRRPDSKGGYAMFPSSAESKRMIHDGRWRIGPSPVDWALQPPLQVPVAVRRDKQSGLTALMMCPADDCFTVATPWNPASPDLS